MKMQKFLSLLNAILGVALSLTPFVLFPVCAEPRPDGTPMNCWYSGVFLTVMGIVVVAFSLLSFWGKLPALFTVLSAVAAVMCWLVPNRIISLAGEGWACALCSRPDHACRAVTAPVLGVLVMASALICVAALVLNFVQPAPAGERRRTNV